MNAVRKYKWKIQVAHDQPDQGHPVLEHLACRTFEMETLDPPPDVGQTFELFYDDYRNGGVPPHDRCVAVEVTHRRQLMVYRNASEPDWYTLLRARISRKAELPW